jgi:hypothetical protein
VERIFERRRGFRISGEKMLILKRGPDSECLIPCRRLGTQVEKNRIRTFLNGRPARHERDYSCTVLARGTWVQLYFWSTKFSRDNSRVLSSCNIFLLRLDRLELSAKLVCSWMFSLGPWKIQTSCIVDLLPKKIGRDWIWISPVICY